MNLAELIEKTSSLVSRAGGELLQKGEVRPVDVDRITDDSRQISTASIFAVTELSRNHLQSALEKNPAAIIVPRNLISGSLLESYSKQGLILYGGKAARSRPEWLLSLMAGAFFHHPDQAMDIVAITGTNGKTSISRMIYHAWKKLNIHCAVIGTLGATIFAGDGERTIQTGYTTPRSYQLLELLQQMQSAGVQKVALEASSEALALGRLEGIRISGGVFCGLSVDHLDYHKTMGRYFMAKAHLFTLLRRSKGRAIVQDLSKQEPDPFAVRLSRYVKRIGIDFTLAQNFRPFDLNVPVEFNIRNANLAMLASESPYDAKLFADMPDVPGRMNRMEVMPGLDAIVDYAHTPDALQRILGQLKGRGFHRLYCVFGCGGNRDPSKRILMGRAALEAATDVIVTDDNPRNEDPEEIRRQIMEACKLPDLVSTSATLRNVGDRRQAIRLALEESREQCQKGLRCCVLVAGKGHEDYQIYGKEKRHFSDAEVILEFKEEVMS
ncbi:MAG: UDP-N-acetylmuramoyl-L-alanyl-D-glutamate--2,6-diaminopimelate ligase [Leptospiraceae bacterium]|nr:UDP-N-acetylmuramoyl-L-alanyl-D-glutamate--2,6-diaminopimelate ligase [Leptospiraceae bacterium]